jgi:deazaflavin-dependent oxidoreductase (nitroreductase family)
MADGQGHEEFVEPTRDQIVVLTRQHVDAMEATDADDVWVLAGMHQLILYTKGRTSGKPHSITVPYWLDAEGHRVVVASFAGAPRDPDWYSNLFAPGAAPEVLVAVQGRKFWARPESLDGEDYERTWAALTTDRPFYNDYQTRCERRIPLVRLAELRPA